MSGEQCPTCEDGNGTIRGLASSFPCPRCNPPPKPAEGEEYRSVMGRLYRPREAECFSHAMDDAAGAEIAAELNRLAGREKSLQDSSWIIGTRMRDFARLLEHCQDMIIHYSGGTPLSEWRSMKNWKPESVQEHAKLLLDEISKSLDETAMVADEREAGVANLRKELAAADRRMEKAMSFINRANDLLTTYEPTDSAAAIENGEPPLVREWLSAAQIFSKKGGVA